MKVLVARLSADGHLKVEGGVDSAVLRCGEPLFIEEPAAQWRSVAAPAVRIGRLGTNISPENAANYVDALGAVHLLVPAEEGEVPAFFRDRAISPGRWLDINEFAGKDGLLINARVCPLPPQAPQAKKFEGSFSTTEIPFIVSRISRTLTFKTGDIIVLAHAGILLGEPHIDTSLEIDIDGVPSLSIRLK